MESRLTYTLRDEERRIHDMIVNILLFADLGKDNFIFILEDLTKVYIV